MMANANAVSDPTDWAVTRIPSLGPLDASLRCQICKDFYTAAVITNCSHTFCSLCIRRAIHADHICPICRAPEQEYRLRKNNTVQEVVDSFIGSRLTLFEMASEAIIPPQAIKMLDTDKTDLQSIPPKPRRGRGRLRSSTKKVIPVVIEDSDKYSEDEVGVIVLDDGLVACPLCQRRMKEVEVNTHLDKCLDPESTPSSPPSLSSTIFGRQPRSGAAPPPSIAEENLKPIANITYSLMKDAQLREKLRTLGIPTHGTKKLMQERHTEWKNIWNANIDSNINQRRSKRELLKDLDTWEKAHIKPANNRTKSSGWSDETWANKNRDDFDLLVEQAKKNAKRRKVAQEFSASPPEKDPMPSHQQMDSVQTFQGATIIESTNPYFATVLSRPSLPQSKSEVVCEGLPPPSSLHSDVYERDEYEPFPSSQRQRDSVGEAQAEKRRFSMVDEPHIPRIS